MFLAFSNVMYRIIEFLIQVLIEQNYSELEYEGLFSSS